MVFHPGKAMAAFVMGGGNMERVSIFKYLGVLFSEKGDWAPTPSMFYSV
jgi:hypothetical protein